MTPSLPGAQRDPTDDDAECTGQVHSGHGDSLSSLDSVGHNLDDNHHGSGRDDTRVEGAVAALLDLDILVNGSHADRERITEAHRDLRRRHPRPAQAIDPDEQPPPIDWDVS